MKNNLPAQNGIWSVTTRGNDGAPKTIQVEAANRSDLFRKLQGMNISAIRIEKGPVRCMRTKRDGKMDKTFVAFIAATVAICGVIGYLMLSSDSGNDTETTPAVKRTRIVETQPSASSQSDRIEETSNCFTTPSIMQLTIGEITNKTETARKIRYMQDPDDPSEYGATEQMIGALLSAPLGVEPIPFPYDFGDDGGMADYLEGISNKIVIIEKDSARDADHKMAIIESKIEMLEMMKDGETPQTILEEAYRMRVAAARIRAEMIDVIQEWIIEENPGDAAVDAALQQFNQRLANDGILEINMEEIEDELETKAAEHENAGN